MTHTPSSPRYLELSSLVTFIWLFYFYRDRACLATEARHLAAFHDAIASKDTLGWLYKYSDRASQNLGCRFPATSLCRRVFVKTWISPRSDSFEQRGIVVDGNRTIQTRNANIYSECTLEILCFTFYKIIFLKRLSSFRRTPPRHEMNNPWWHTSSTFRRSWGCTAREWERMGEGRGWGVWGGGWGGWSRLFLNC